MLELLQNRRSIRKYEPRKIEAEKTDILKKALLRAPSSRGINPWEFIMVEDQRLLTELARAQTPRGLIFERRRPWDRYLRE